MDKVTLLRRALETWPEEIIEGELISLEGVCSTGHMYNVLREEDPTLLHLWVGMEKDKKYVRQIQEKIYDFVGDILEEDLYFENDKFFEDDYDIDNIERSVRMKKYCEEMLRNCENS